MNQTVNASVANFSFFNYSASVDWLKNTCNITSNSTSLWDTTKACASSLSQRAPSLISNLPSMCNAAKVRIVSLFQKAASSTFVEKAIPAIARAYLSIKETCIVQTCNIIKIVSGTISPSLATELSKFGKATCSLLDSVLSAVSQNCQTPVLHPTLELASEYPLAITSMALSLLYKACTFFKDRKIKELKAENAQLRNQLAA